MGSIIEVFPGADAASTRRALRAWRSAPVAGTGAPRVRGAKLEDYAAIRALQRHAHPDLPAWSLKQLEAQLAVFPEGQSLAVSGGEVVGASSTLVVQWEDHGPEPSWKSLTGEGSFNTHTRSARTLFVAEIALDQERHGAGAGRALLQAHRRLARKLNLRRIVRAVPLTGYQSVKDSITPELYAQRVLWGNAEDAALRLQLAQGFQYCGILRNYLPGDASSSGHAALTVWLNPLFSPKDPPADVEAPERTRKCA